MSDHYNFTVSEENIGDRIDKVLSKQLPEMSRSSLQKLVNDGCVLVNGNIVSKNYKIKTVILSQLRYLRLRNLKPNHRISR